MFIQEHNFGTNPEFKCGHTDGVHNSGDHLHQFFEFELIKEGEIEITVDGELDGEIYVAGAKLEQGKLLSAGGRVLGVTAKGADLKEAIEKAYKNTAKVHFENAFYRKDIGNRALQVYNNK